jgi:hypothetical protein
MATLPSALRKFYAFFSDAFCERKEHVSQQMKEKGKGVVRFSVV